MKESEFISQNKEKWKEFEDALTGADTDPARTNKLFIQITDDLSYARTFYSNRSVRLYLNGVARLLFNDLNNSKSRGWREFINFWKHELPVTIYRARRAMLLSLAVFVSCFTIGVVTSMHDPGFAASILGADYVMMTEENIRQGDPMAVYKSNDEVMMFLPILYNNLKVDFVTFFSGIFMAIGSLVVMVANGVMVGVFQYFFIERGLFWESFLTIWTHGSLEIPTIILSGGAGLTFGRGLLFPGTHTRLQAFKMSAKNGLIIILGVVPLTFIAALVEGFLTRHTEINDLLRLAFILLSFSAVLAYYLFYARKAGRRSPERTKEDLTLIYKEKEVFDATQVKPSGRLISETFYHFFRGFGAFAKVLFPITILYAIVVAWNPVSLLRDPDNTEFNATILTSFNEFPLLAVLTLSYICVFAVSGSRIAWRLTDQVSTGNSKSEWSTNFYAAVTALAGTSLLSMLFFMDIGLSLFLSIILLPFILFITSIAVFTKLSPFRAFARSAGLASESPGKVLITFFSFALISFVLYIACRNGLDLLLLSEAASWMLTDDDILSEKIRHGMLAFQTLLSVGIYVLLCSICSALLYYTLHESETAEGLLKKIRSV